MASYSRPFIANVTSQALGAGAPHGDQLPSDLYLRRGHHLLGDGTHQFGIKHVECAARMPAVEAGICCYAKRAGHFYAARVLVALAGL